ncbi:MAG: hypothetical protein ABJF50_24660 [Paracoccaceae bacterium]
MNNSLKIELFRASEKALRNREILAAVSGRPRFGPREIWSYVGAATAFPLLRALFQRRFKVPEITGDAIAIGSRKRAKYRPAQEGQMPLDDLEYDWNEQTYRFFDFRIATHCYLTLLRFLPFILTLWVRRSAWCSAHFAVCLVEWTYLRCLLKRHPQIKNVYSGYYVDRKAFLVSLIQSDIKIRHIGLQHGSFNVFPTLHRAKVDEVILIYPFSRNFAKCFFSIDDSVEIRVAPELFDLGWKKRGSEKSFIVYGASVDSKELNRDIIIALDRYLPKSIEIMIKLHPRDNSADYLDLLHGRVALIDFNAKDAKVYVGQLSSVIAEAWTFNVPIAVMYGDTARGSDFQRNIDVAVQPDAVSLARAVANMVEDKNAR